MLANELDARQALKMNRTGVFIPLTSKESRCSCNSYRSQLTRVFIASPVSTGQVDSVSGNKSVWKIVVWKRQHGVCVCVCVSVCVCVCLCVCVLCPVSGGGGKRGQPSVLSRRALCASR